ncbi:murein hydrolase activator EnvC family protein [Streptomyces sp. NPDC018045]|uniref:murein hydrolase activator EnvC family protein n=1 Tax=Streptomyces sp. NPDC018045 TaxID=3365037 RepID=UPI0037B38AF8
MRQRTVFETVRAVVTWRPARAVRAVRTTVTRHPRVWPGRVRPAVPATPVRTGCARRAPLIGHTSGAGQAGLALPHAGVRWTAYARRTSPPAIRLLALCVMGTASAVLLAGAAAVGVAFAEGAPPSSPEPPRSTERHPPPGRPLDSGPVRTAPATTDNRAWPVAGPTGARPTVARGWEPPPAPWAPGHRGVDLLAAKGATVRAAAPGRVLFAGKVAGRGVLSIEVSESGNPPLRTTYEPVTPTVRKGDHVTAGQPVATLGPGPYHCSDPCLHWGLLRDKTYLDPLSLLPASMLHPGPARLLPVIGVPEPSDEPGHRDPPFARQSRHSTSADTDRSRKQALPRPTGQPSPDLRRRTAATSMHHLTKGGTAREGRTARPVSPLRPPGPWRPQPP